MGEQRTERASDQRNSTGKVLEQTPAKEKWATMRRRARWSHRHGDVTSVIQSYCHGFEFFVET